MKLGFSATAQVSSGTSLTSIDPAHVTQSKLKPTSLRIRSSVAFLEEIGRQPDMKEMRQTEVPDHNANTTPNMDGGETE